MGQARARSGPANPSGMEGIMTGDAYYQNVRGEMLPFVPSAGGSS